MTRCSNLPAGRQERFRETGEGSFFGELIYQRLVPQEHFLRKLREMLPWESLTEQWVALYKGGAEPACGRQACLPAGRYGPPPYHPSVVLKMLFLAYLYNLSERQVEQKFGEAKAWHGLGRCRYLGLACYRLQAYITVLVLNLKRMVKLIHGLGFRQPPRRLLQAA